MIFKWKDKFSTGIEEIDKQHKRLFEIGGELYTIASLDDGFDHYDEIVVLINSLKNYTRYHFSFEEKFMEGLNFQGLDGHKIQHKSFISKLEEVEDKDIDINQKQVVLDMIDFIINWISGHIIGSDFKYKDLAEIKQKNNYSFT